MNCEHEITQGDSYGVSCRACGAVLRGYGYGGFFGADLVPGRECLHEPVPLDNASNICIYCQRVTSIN